MVQAYAAMDRIPSLSLDDRALTPEEIAISLFLPNRNETDMIR